MDIREQEMNRVERLRQVHSEIERLAEEERMLARPTVTNMGMIRNLFDVFCLTLKYQDTESNPLDTNNRKKFLYAILYLFSPSTLAGQVMKHKMRRCVSDIIGCTPTGVSRDYKTSIFFYATYSDFRNSVNNIIDNMLLVLGKYK